METIVYIFKVNVAILLLYSFYRLFFQRDTFFKWKRIFFLSVMFLSLLYPLLKIAGTVSSENTLKDGILFPIYNLNEIIITPNGATVPDAFSAANSIFHLLVVVYLAVVVLLFTRIIIQLITLLLNLKNTTIREFAGNKLHVKPGLRTPYSFFGWIVLDLDKYSEKELTEILLHENTHVRQGHSFDTIFSEILCVFCWFNPCIWLMKKDIRMNLEYLADRSVLQSGCEAEHYQFHLLQLSYSKAIAKITNNFNVSPLKKRILMMNKKQTSLRGIWKYALLIQVVTFLVFFNLSLKAESPILAPIQKGINENAPLVEETPTAVEANVNDDVLPKKKTIKFTPPKNTQKEEAQDKKTDKEPIFSHVESPPSFPGGEKAIVEYLTNNIKYPESAVKNSIQGQVVVRFIVDSTGKVINVEVLRSLDTACDAEAIRVIEAMPNWIPGKQNGKAVSVYYILPILFRLQDKPVEKGMKITDLITLPKDVVVSINGKEASQDEVSKLTSGNIERVDVYKETMMIDITTKK